MSVLCEHVSVPGQEIELAEFRTLRLPWAAPFLTTTSTSLLPGGQAWGPQGPAAALVGAELDLPWLPPGWVVPGLEFWRNEGAWPDRE